MCHWLVRLLGRAGIGASRYWGESVVSGFWGELTGLRGINYGYPPAAGSPDKPACVVWKRVVTCGCACMGEGGDVWVRDTMLQLWPLVVGGSSSMFTPFRLSWVYSNVCEQVNVSRNLVTAMPFQRQPQVLLVLLVMLQKYFLSMFHTSVFYL